MVMTRGYSINLETAEPAGLEKGPQLDGAQEPLEEADHFTILPRCGDELW
jgi:hypothetical protein